MRGMRRMFGPGGLSDAVVLSAHDGRVWLRIGADRAALTPQQAVEVGRDLIAMSATAGRPPDRLAAWRKRNNLPARGT